MIFGLFARHVTGWLSAYHEGVLPAREASRIAAHLLACPRCRRELDLVRAGARLGGQMRVGREDDDGGAPSWAELAPLLDAPAPVRTVAWRWVPAVALALVVVASAAWSRGPVPRAATASSLEEVAVTAYEQGRGDPGGDPRDPRPTDDPRVVRRWIAGEPVTLLVANAPGSRATAKSIDYRTVDGLRVASWTRDDRRYVLVSRLAGEAACTICHTAPAGTVL